MYPFGAIYSIDELKRYKYVSGASKYFHTVEKERNALSLTVADLEDYNILKINYYNDWFYFARREDAKAWAKSSLTLI